MKKFSKSFIASFCGLCLTAGLFLTGGGLSLLFFGESTHPDMKEK